MGLAEMDLAHRFRVTFAVAISVAAGGSIVLTGGVTAGAPAAQLLPDLRTMAPPEWDPLRLAHNSKGTVSIRIPNRVGNQGAGPLELYPEPATDSGGIDCTVGEYPDPHDRDANQRIWEDTNDNGEWDGPDDADPDSISEEPKVGCFEYHPAHGHWHFQDFSLYSLADPEGGELVAGPSRKISFCILDGDQFDNVPDHPHTYPGGDGGCGDFDPDTEEPTEPGTMGLSVGWADTYTSSLPGQKLDITGVDRGLYCLLSTANPLHASDDTSQIVESDLENNSRRRLVKLNPSQGKIELAGGGCPAPPG